MSCKIKKLKISTLRLCEDNTNKFQRKLCLSNSTNRKSYCTAWLRKYVRSDTKKMRKIAICEKSWIFNYTQKHR